MVKHCPQLGSTWPRSVHFWKINPTYFPVICQYLTLIWQQKNPFGTALCAHCGRAFLVCLRWQRLLYFMSPSLEWEVTVMWMWRQPVAINISKLVWRPARSHEDERRGWCDLTHRQASICFSSPVWDWGHPWVTYWNCQLSCIKNDTRIICRFVCIIIPDMLNVRRCWQWQSRTRRARLLKPTWSRLSKAIIKHRSTSRTC